MVTMIQDKWIIFPMEFFYNPSVQLMESDELFNVAEFTPDLICYVYFRLCCIAAKKYSTDGIVVLVEGEEFDVGKFAYVIKRDSSEVEDV